MVPSPVRVNPIEPILEFDRTENPFRQAVVKAPIEHVRGVVKIPNGPGLGIEINRDALAEFRMKDD
jgi:D-galactarolactone cycloisomerase